MPKGLQNVMELMVEGVNKFSTSIMGAGKKAAEAIDRKLQTK